MGNSVYQINKGVNRSIEFKGLKAQYIWWLGALVTGLLVLFAVLYICGVHALICIGVVGLLSTLGIVRVYHISNTYGEHGMMVKMAKTKIPKVIIVKSRKVWKIK
ncbi:MAG: DUF4133 domain-containing protein [Agriterribacter sp.]